MQFEDQRSEEEAEVENYIKKNGNNLGNKAVAEEKRYVTHKI